MTNSSAQGLALVHAGRTTRLKWHRLRRRMRDPLFSAETMAEGFRLGASMELDMRVRGDGGFVVLHDDLLEGETNGQGRVAELGRAEMAELSFADTPRPLIFSEDLAAMLRLSHPDALLQFDMKDDYEAVGVEGVAHLARFFADIDANIIVSADSLALIEAIRTEVPSLMRGIDPTNGLVDIYKQDGIAAVERSLLADLRGSTAPDTIYLAWQLVLKADADGLDLIGLCHQEGKKVDAWTFTLKDPERGFDDDEWTAFNRLMALGADQITTDEAIATEAAWDKRIAAA